MVVTRFGEFYNANYLVYKSDAGDTIDLCVPSYGFYSNHQNIV